MADLLLDAVAVTDLVHGDSRHVLSTVTAPSCTVHAAEHEMMTLSIPPPLVFVNKSSAYQASYHSHMHMCRIRLMSASGTPPATLVCP